MGWISKRKDNRHVDERRMSEEKSHEVKVVSIDEISPRSSSK